MKIAVIGAGISGLAFAKYAKIQSVSVKLFEKNTVSGGIAKVKNVDGQPYHMIGGHCFNSKFPHVMDFVFDHVLPVDNWHKVERKASIILNGYSVPYPIEFSMKEIYARNPELAVSFINDYLTADRFPANSLQDWFINNFGESLAEEYFIPYNRKIWGREPSTMSPDWVVDKLPQPNNESFIKGLLDSSSDSMPHSSFYYPKSGTQNTFIEALASGLDIEFNSEVTGLHKNEQGKFDINGELFDEVIYTGPLDSVAKVFDIDDSDVLSSINRLEFNKVTTVLWEREETDDTWSYIPSEDILFHRLIHIGNFTQERSNVSISEAVGEVSYEDMVKAGEKLSILKKPLAYNVSNHAYVVFNKTIQKDKEVIFNHFSNSGVHLLGRFGQWDYFNMDICILEAIKLFNELKK